MPIWRIPDSTIASGQGSPYFSRRSLSRDPALTPMRIEQPWSLAAFTTSRTRSADPMLPGLIRRHAAPACAASIARLWWKWMSATIGTGLAAQIAFSAAVDSRSGQDTRTMSAPASAQARTWAMVARVSGVSVLVMVCTEIGASPPTSTFPTRILRLGRRAMSRQGRTLMSGPSCSEDGLGPPGQGSWRR